MVTINRYIKALLHPAGGHQGGDKAHQAGNQNIVRTTSQCRKSVIQPGKIREPSQYKYVVLPA